MVDVAKHPSIAGANAKPGNQSASNGTLWSRMSKQERETVRKMDEGEIDPKEEDFLFMGGLES